MARTGHVVQIGVGFEAVICRLQKRIGTLQSFRDSAIDQLESVVELRSVVAAAVLDLVEYVAGDGVVATETLRLENLVLVADQELEAKLKELRASARLVRKPTPGPDDMNGVDEEDDVIYEAGRNAQEDLHKSARRIRRSAAEWNSGADSYATSDFNSKTTNKNVISGKDGIPSECD
ncbi:hypothetical protein HDU99_003288 [Rhizoclosmatium hyalinum]|nr:hypothetical protein HDU99_003288 [Rhizoclosmatium hyalinum]